MEYDLDEFHPMEEFEFKRNKRIQHAASIYIDPDTACEYELECLSKITKYERISILENNAIEIIYKSKWKNIAEVVYLSKSNLIIGFQFLYYQRIITAYILNTFDVKQIGSKIELPDNLVIKDVPPYYKNGKYKNFIKYALTPTNHIHHHEKFYFSYKTKIVFINKNGKIFVNLFVDNVKDKGSHILTPVLVWANYSDNKSINYTNKCNYNVGDDYFIHTNKFVEAYTSHENKTYWRLNDIINENIFYKNIVNFKIIPEYFNVRVLNISKSGKTMGIRMYINDVGPSWVVLVRKFELINDFVKVYTNLKAIPIPNRNETYFYLIPGICNFNILIDRYLDYSDLEDDTGYEYSEQREFSVDEVCYLCGHYTCDCGDVSDML